MNYVSFSSVNEKLRHESKRDYLSINSLKKKKLLIDIYVIKLPYAHYICHQPETPGLTIFFMAIAIKTKEK